VIDVPVRERLKDGRKLNCWWCSSQRRIELARAADASGASKIALGHHLDDILETFLMNMSAKGE
jgi:tRNA 2-thiocytidine biosynthesis protein TtcA